MVLPSSLVAAQSTLVLIMQRVSSLRKFQPENRTVSMDKCQLFSAPMPELQCMALLVKAFDWNSEEPGLNPGWISTSFFTNIFPYVHRTGSWVWVDKLIFIDCRDHNVSLCKTLLFIHAIIMCLCYAQQSIHEQLINHIFLENSPRCYTMSPWE